MNKLLMSRFGRDKDIRTGQTLEDRIPAWIDQVPRVGWPVVAVVVMVMCAPGEHHLAVMAGWDERLAWGMPACLVAYAGIAASVATRKARGTQGRRTAVLGAFLSLGAAMSAQPISHMFVTGHWDSDPSPAWVVWSVSLVPPLVLGHLMHVAASHVVSRRGQDKDKSATRPAEDKQVILSPAAVPADRTVPVPSWATEEKVRRTAQDTISRAYGVPLDVLLSDADKDRTVRPGAVVTADNVKDVSAPRPPRPAVPSVPSLGDRRNMSARALELARAGHDRNTIKDMLRTEFTAEDGTAPKADSVNKAAARALDKVS